MLFQDEKLGTFSELFFRNSAQPTLKQEWLNAERFDYSVDSLRLVDDFLLRVRHEQATQEEWARLVIRCGAYVGEVIRQNCSTHSYHWIDYDDAIKVNAEIAELGNRLGTVFVLYRAPKVLCFPLSRIEKFLEYGSENSVFAFAEVMLSEAMPTPSQKAAEALYQQAQQRWAEAVDFSFYDDKSVILGITPMLEAALSDDGNHLPSLSLLSDLLIMLGAYEETEAVASRLQTLEPDNQVHATKRHLLKQANTIDGRFDLEDWILERWRTN